MKKETCCSGDMGYTAEEHSTDKDCVDKASVEKHDMFCQLRRSERRMDGITSVHGTGAVVWVVVDMQ